jgi:hypothetical protein
VRVLWTLVASAAMATVLWTYAIAAGQAPQLSDWRNMAGVWELVSLQDHRPNGDVLDWMGKQPTGTLIYSPEGRMSLQILRDPPSRVVGPMWSSDGRDLVAGASADEIRDAYRGFYAYFGTWELDEAAHTVTHRVQGSVRSMEVGVPYVRPYELSGERLVLRSPIVAADGERQTRVVTWRRAERF